LLFTRDQQIVTNKGLILARLDSPQRRHESSIMKVVWEWLGVPIIAEVQYPDALEGGDFFPLGDELCFIGVGLRTSREAVNKLLDSDLFGSRRVAVVQDLYDRSQDRMHLDTVFSIVNDTTVVLLDSIIGSENLKRRTVTEYKRNPNDHKYTVSVQGQEFSQYLAANGFRVILIPNEHQLKYGMNFINMGNSNILCPYEPTVNLLKEKTGLTTIQFINYSALTVMYGGPHCSTQVFRPSSLS